MSISEQLDGLRAAIPGCSLVAFGDLDARLVLRSSSDRPRPQERLDELCAQAASVLSDAAGDMMLTQLFGKSGHAPTDAMVLTQSETRIFVRSEGPQADVLCCVCDTTDAARQATAAARSTLQKISEG